jgi:NADH-quinone oxidoreductase subunit L
MAPALYQLFYRRWYIDELYDAVIVRPITVGGRAVYRFFDQLALDGTVDAVGLVTRWFSGEARGIQTGYVRNYALSILFGAFLIVAYYVIGGR